MERIVKPLLLWFKENKRDLPWRRDVTPYKIYISEIMLQQTRVEAVKPYYERFLVELPDFYALAKVSDEKLFKLWEGLGYYSRAKNLKKCAQVIVEQYHGEFPKTYQEAIQLPGIGMYTAGAILSRAYGSKVAAVDGNVLRVFSRLFLDDRDILKDTTKKAYKEEIEKIMPKDAGAFNEALMDLGATICMPKVALCDACPFSSFCKAKKEDVIFSYPKKKLKQEKTYFEYTLLFVTDGNKYILLPKEDGVLKGLASPILIDSYLTDNEIEEILLNQYDLHVKNILPLKEDKHIFSHQLWYMKAYQVYVDSIKDYPGYTEVEIKEKIGLPTAYRKFINVLF